MSNTHIKDHVDQFKKFSESTIDSFSNNISKVKLGLTATREVFDLIYVNNEPVSELCAIKIENAFKIVLKPYDTKRFKDVYNSLLQSKFGLQVGNTSKTNEIEVIFPNLTVERKESYIEIGKQQLENYKDGFKKNRNKFREDFIKSLKDSNLPKDTLRQFDNEINKVTNDFDKDVEHIYNNFVKSLKK